MPQHWLTPHTPPLLQVMPHWPLLQVALSAFGGTVQASQLEGPHELMLLLSTQVPLQR